MFINHINNNLRLSNYFEITFFQIFYGKFFLYQSSTSSRFTLPTLSSKSRKGSQNLLFFTKNSQKPPNNRCISQLRPSSILEPIYKSSSPESEILTVRTILFRFLVKCTPSEEKFPYHLFSALKVSGSRSRV